MAVWWLAAWLLLLISPLIVKFIIPSTWSQLTDAEQTPDIINPDEDAPQDEGPEKQEPGEEEPKAGGPERKVPDEAKRDGESNAYETIICTERIKTQEEATVKANDNPQKNVHQELRDLFPLIKRVYEQLYKIDSEGQKQSILALVDARLGELETLAQATKEQIGAVGGSLNARFEAVEQKLSAILAQRELIGFQIEEITRILNVDVIAPGSPMSSDRAKEESTIRARNPLGMCPPSDPAPKADEIKISGDPSHSVTREPKVHEIPIGPVVTSLVPGDRVHWAAGHPTQMRIEIQLNDMRFKAFSFQNPKILLEVLAACTEKTRLFRYEKDAQWWIEGYANGSFNDIYFFRNQFGRSILLRIPDAKKGRTAADLLFMKSSQATVNLLHRLGVMTARCLFIEPTGDLLPFTKSDGSLEPGLRFSIEEKLKGLPAYHFWDVETPARDLYRRAIMEAVTEQMARMHRQNIRSKAMGMLDPDCDIEKIPEDGFYPAIGLFGYHAVDRPAKAWISQDIFAHARHVRTNLKFNCAMTWRTDLFTRWSQSFERSQMSRHDQHVLFATLNILEVVLKVINNRVQADAAANGQIFTMGHPDLDLQNVLASIPEPLPGQARCIAKVSLIDLDDAKFMPQDRGYLAYPLFLMKSHFLADHHFVDSQRPGRSAADYTSLRREYVDILFRALGSTEEAARLIKTWTYGSHIVRTFDSVLEYSLSHHQNVSDKILGPAFFAEALTREILGHPRRTTGTQPWHEDWLPAGQIRWAAPDQVTVDQELGNFSKCIETGMQKLLNQP